MAFSQINENFELLKKDIQAYINTKVEYFQLRALKKSTDLVSRLIRMILISIIFIFFLVFASTAAAIWIGNELENLVYGFLIVAGFYLFILILILLFGRVLFRRQILKSFSFKIIKMRKIKF